jgi:large subunit ribosomal protein L28
MRGHQVSHSNHKTNRFYYPNLQTKRFFIPELNKWISVKLTTRAIRTASKVGIYQFLKGQLAKGFDPEVFCTDDNAPKKEGGNQRGYRRVETVDAAGNKSYSITYEPENARSNRKVRLSKIFK